ncbi:MAG: mechanosensitive ion channel family protein [Burkholderiales bacterium]|nr:mechanosensitive ion channel family protein [Burkholderiales bacterium]
MLKKLLDQIIQQYVENSVIAKILGDIITLGIIVIGAIFVYYCVRFIINHFIKPLLEKSNSEFLHEVAQHGSSGLIGHLFSALIFRIGSNFVVSHDDVYASLFSIAMNKLSILYIFIVLVVIITNTVKLINPYYEQKFENASRYPIMPYINVVVVVIWFCSIIIIIAFFTNTPLTKVFAGLGAASAVFLLVFRDTLLGIMSSIQASASNIVRVGDRIAIDQYNLDGVVQTISFNIVKIRSLDNTTATIPTYMLTSQVVKNYRTVSEYGYRRIKRAVFIDVNSVRCVNSDEILNLDSANLLGRYLASKMTGKTTTNLELFRLSVEDYLRNCPYIKQNEDLIVYQLSPTPNGLPIEIYAYTSLVNWAEFEHLQSQIIEYSLVIMKQFDLLAFQNHSI